MASSIKIALLRLGLFDGDYADLLENFKGEDELKIDYLSYCSLMSYGWLPPKTDGL
jgi:hypothetical protein